MVHVGKYTNPMDPVGYNIHYLSGPWFRRALMITVMILSSGRPIQPTSFDSQTAHPRVVGFGNGILSSDFLASEVWLDFCCNLVSSQNPYTQITQGMVYSHMFPYIYHRNSPNVRKYNIPWMSGLTKLSELKSRNLTFNGFLYGKIGWLFNLWHYIWWKFQQ